MADFKEFTLSADKTATIVNMDNVTYIQQVDEKTCIIHFNSVNQQGTNMVYVDNGFTSILKKAGLIK